MQVAISHSSSPDSRENINIWTLARPRLICIMDFFATGGFQQLYSELDAEEEPLAILAGIPDDPSCGFECSYAEASFVADCHHLEESDYYGIITLDSNNNNNNNQEDQSLFIDFNDLSSVCPPDLSDWEQRLLDNYVEIPELVDFLPERTPLCTDNCVDFLEESNSNLRLAAPPPVEEATEPKTSTAPSWARMPLGSGATCAPLGIAKRSMPSPPTSRPTCAGIWARSRTPAAGRSAAGASPAPTSWPATDAPTPA